MEPIVPEDDGVVPMTDTGPDGPVGTEEETEAPQVTNTSDEPVNAPTTSPQNPLHPEERYEEGYVNNE